MQLAAKERIAKEKRMVEARERKRQQDEEERRIQEAEARQLEEEHREQQRIVQLQQDVIQRAKEVRIAEEQQRIARERAAELARQQKMRREREEEVREAERRRKEEEEQAEIQRVHAERARVARLAEQRAAAQLRKEQQRQAEMRRVAEENQQATADAIAAAMWSCLDDVLKPASVKIATEHIFSQFPSCVAVSTLAASTAAAIAVANSRVSQASTPGSSKRRRRQSLSPAATPGPSYLLNLTLAANPRAFVGGPSALDTGTGAGTANATSPFSPFRAAIAAARPARGSHGGASEAATGANAVTAFHASPCTKRQRPMAPLIDLSRMQFATKALVFCRWLGDGVEPAPYRSSKHAAPRAGSPGERQLLLDGPGVKGGALEQRLMQVSTILYPLAKPDTMECDLAFWAAHAKRFRKLFSGLHGREGVKLYIIYSGWESVGDASVIQGTLRRGLDLERIHGAHAVNAAFVAFGTQSPSKSKGITASKKRRLGGPPKPRMPRSAGLRA